MTSVTNGNEQAFPLSENEFTHHQPGITKREHFASMAMLGLLAGGTVQGAGLAALAVSQANYLLSALPSPAPESPR